MTRLKRRQRRNRSLLIVRVPSRRSSHSKIISFHEPSDPSTTRRLTLLLASSGRSTPALGASGTTSTARAHGRQQRSGEGRVRSGRRVSQPRRLLHRAGSFGCGGLLFPTYRWLNTGQTYSGVSSRARCCMVDKVVIVLVDVAMNFVCESSARRHYFLPRPGRQQFWPFLPVVPNSSHRSLIARPRHCAVTTNSIAATGTRTRCSPCSPRAIFPITIPK